MEYDLYCEIIDLLKEIKLTTGPVGLDSTLKRRPEIRKFLLNYQKRTLEDYTEEIKGLPPKN